MQERSSKKGVATRDRIISIARHLYSSRSFSSVGLSEIASATGLRASLILYHFPDVRKIFEDVFVQMIEEGQVIGQSAIQNSGNARVDLIAYVRSMFAWMTIDPSNRSLLLQFYSESIFHTEWKKMNSEMVRVGKERIYGIIETGVHQQLFAPRDLEGAAISIQDLITGAVFRIATEPEIEVDLLRERTVGAAVRIAMGEFSDRR